MSAVHKFGRRGFGIPLKSQKYIINFFLKISFFFLFGRLYVGQLKVRLLKVKLGYVRPLELRLDERSLG